MNQTTAENLMKITEESYQKIAASFSDTRNFSWTEIDLAIKKYLKNNMQILDLGCGNGRLLISLKKYLENFDYLGLDSCQELIKKAQVSFLQVSASSLSSRAEAERSGGETEKSIFVTPRSDTGSKKINFIHQNILDLKKFSDNSFACIFMIASFNHIASQDLREKLLLDVKRILKPDGVLIMTNWNLWQIGAKKSFWNNFLKSHFTDYRLPITDYQEIITLWQNQFPLYYHAFTLGELKKLFQKSNLEVLVNYYVTNGKKMHWFNGKNILTAGQKK